MTITRLPSLFETDPLALDEPLRNLMRPWRWSSLPEAPQMKMDVSEAEGVYTVKAEIPGVRKEDIHVELDGAKVTISAEVKKETEQKQGSRVLRSERQYGWASRSFTLAGDVDDAKSVAKYENGILELTLPKKGQASAKKVQVS